MLTQDSQDRLKIITPILSLLFFLMFVPAMVFAWEDCGGALNERVKEACVRANYEEADRELNRVFQAFISVSEKPELLRQTQRAWVQFRDAECSYVGSWETLTKNGPYLNRYMCLEAITLYRVKTLINLRIMYESRPQNFVMDR